MAKVYLLSVYEEHGSYNVVATMDKEKVYGIANSDRFLGAHQPLPRESCRLTDEAYAAYKSKTIDSVNKANHRLSELLVTDAPVDGVDLMGGWGGVQLHIVELQ